MLPPEFSQNAKIPLPVRAIRTRYVCLTTRGFCTLVGDGVLDVPTAKRQFVQPGVMVRLLDKSSHPSYNDPKTSEVIRMTEILQHKDGVLTMRVRAGERSCVVKQFENPEFTREIENYRLLSALDVPTLRVLSFEERSITLEDIAASDRWRLGREEDLSDPGAAAALARWYRRLHDRGRGAAGEGYDESDLFTRENLEKLPEFTGTVGHPAWEALDRHFDAICQRLRSLDRTVTYNDFWWTNLAVAKDGREALMFDYNLMGRGYAYADVRNVTVSLNPEAARAFLAEYGPIDPMERAVDDVVAPIVALIQASRRPAFPEWAEDSRRALDGLCGKIEALL